MKDKDIGQTKLEDDAWLVNIKKNHVKWDKIQRMLALFSSFSDKDKPIGNQDDKNLIDKT